MQHFKPKWTGWKSMNCKVFPDWMELVFQNPEIPINLSVRTRGPALITEQNWNIA
jgi:hypothetical protein